MKNKTHDYLRVDRESLIRFCPINTTTNIEPRNLLYQLGQEGNLLTINYRIKAVTAPRESR
ncbi:hypothetical protein BGM30_21320 [Microcystis aeruginosa NIES-298]|uniref:Uncharacterized protein n=1 Tax=Microcystis aeruginosa NIES-298 TaxID=449468 RepID=A0A9P2YJ29_MICAE|nr:hypothetical protein BGM30_21320 [Microcystis aeruginosa NIES-298]